jgi:hypothetical protein
MSKAKGFQKTKAILRMMLKMDHTLNHAKEVVLVVIVAYLMI